MLSPWRQRRRLSTYLLTYLRAKSESTADQEFGEKETTMTSKTTSSALSTETAPGADDRGRHTRRREGSDVRTSEVAERTSRSIPGRSKIRHYRPRHLECTLQPPLGWRWGGYSQFDKTWEVGKRSMQDVNDAHLLGIIISCVFVAAVKILLPLSVRSNGEYYIRPKSTGQFPSFPDLKFPKR